MKIIELSHKIIPNKEPLTSEIDGEKVMLSLELDKYFGMNPVGSAIWEMLEAEPTFQELIDKLTQKYDVDTETCTKETREFLQHLLEQKLIEIA